MSQRSRVAASLGCLLAVAACGGGAKSPGTCPAGTVLKGADCIPSDSGDDDSSGSSSASSSSSSSSSTGKSGGAGGGGDDSSTPPSTGGTPYDKDAVEVALKRAARQIKSACGSATDSDGKANGPWGSTKVTVTIGRNGHIKQVAVPSPYDGKPVGDCISHAFQKGVFPPYAASSDATVEWDVEVVQPKP
jgi:hypothetical protein